MPAIKREDHSASPDMSDIPQKSANTPCARSDARHARQMHLPPAISSIVRPYIVTNQAHLAPVPYVGSSPRKYRLDVLGQKDAHKGLPTQPISRFPSRLASSMATAATNATMATTTTTMTNGHAITPLISNTIVSSDQRSQHEHDSSTTMSNRMDDHLSGTDPNMHGGEVGGFPATSLRGTHGWNL